MPVARSSIERETSMAELGRTDLDHLLDARRGDVLDAWRKAIVAGYQPQAARLLAGGGDGFRNPLRQRIDQTTEAVLTALASASAGEALAAALDPFVRVQAIQDRRPSEALAFVFLLKRAVRDVADDALDARELERFDARVDELALAAFDVYAGCRDQLQEIRVREARRRVSTLLTRLDRAEPEAGESEQPADVGPR
jgi:RsbT co-antagonist protein rsbRD N-terminal domain